MGRAFFFNRFPKMARLFLWTISSLFGFFSISLLILALTLSNGPISLNFAKSYIEDYFAAQDSPHLIQVDDAELAWDEEGKGFIVRAKNVHFSSHNADHHTLKLPNFEFRYKLTSLVKLKFIPCAVTVIEPHLKLYQDADGNLHLNKEENSDDNLTGNKDVLSNILNSPLKSLHELDVRGMKVDVEDLETGQLWNISGINTTLRRDGPDLKGDITLEGLGANAQAQIIAKTEKVDGARKLIEISFSGHFSDFNFKDLNKFWHKSLAPPARDWVIANLSGAKVHKGSINATWQIDFAAETPKLVTKKVDGEIHFSDMQVRYFGNMPAVTDVKAVAKYTDKVFDIEIQKGQLQDIAITSGRVYITGMDLKDQHIDIDLNVEGPLQTALSVLNKDPLFLSKKLGVKLENIKAKSKGKLHFAFPLETTLTTDQVDFQANTTLEDVVIEKPLRQLVDWNLTKGKLDLSVNRDSMVVSGKALFGSIPTDLVWAQKFQDNPEDWKVKYDIKAQITPEHMAQSGYDNYTDGPLLVKAQLQETGQEAAKLSIDVDFTNSAIALPGLESVRQKGDQGHLYLNASLVNGKLEKVDSLKVTGKAIHLEPKIDIDPQTWAIRSLICPNALLGQTQVNFKLVTDLRGKYHVNIKGKSLDLESLLEYLKNRKDNDNPIAPFHFTCAIENAWFNEGQRSLHRLEARGYHGKNALETLALTGKLMHHEKGHIGDLQVQQTSDAGNQNMQMLSNNAGEVLHMLGLTSSIRRGNLVLNLSREGQGHWKGKLKVKDFNVENAPVVTHLLSLASPFGIIEAVAGAPLSFSKFSTHLVVTDDKIYVKQGRAVGTSIGLNVAGTIDRKTDTTHLHGTILPYNALNMFLSKVPVISSLLGGKGGGVLGLSYGISGPTDSPTSYVNPLSVLTPGVLRAVFSHPEPDENEDQKSDGD